MSHSIRKSVPHLINSKLNRLLVLQLSTLQVENANSDSFSVKYLIDKCGLYRDKAVSASRYLNFDKPDKPDACLSFLKSHGFTDTQLAKLLTKCPRLVMYGPEKTLLPKIQFLHSMGFVEADIPALLVAEPNILLRSLEGHIVPIFDLLKDHLGSVEKTVKTITTCPRIMAYSQTSVIERNIRLVKEAGVTSRCIASALGTQPLVFGCSSDKMEELVEDIKKMGFDPGSWRFMAGVCTMGSLTKLAWKNKLEVYRKWGCSQEEVLTAFKKRPWFMKVSEEKIDGVMNFLVNEMGCSPGMVLQGPEVFSYSLQKRIVPRCSVYQLLLSKGLLKEKGSFYGLFKYSEDKFLEKFINCYPEEAPELLRLHGEKLKKSNEQI